MCIHAVTVYDDALTVASGGTRSAEGERARAAEVLHVAPGCRAPADTVKLAGAFLARKGRVPDRVRYG